MWRLDRKLYIIVHASTWYQPNIHILESKLKSLQKDMVVLEISRKLARMKRIKTWTHQTLLFSETATASCLFSCMDNENRLQKERERERRKHNRTRNIAV